MNTRTPAVAPAAIALIAAVAALAAGGCSDFSEVDALVRARADHLHAQVLAPLGGPDAPAAAYVQKVGRRIADAAKALNPPGDDWRYGADLRFLLVGADVPGVFTAGGDHVYVSAELFRRCRSEADLAAALAHAYAHVHGRHLQLRGKEAVGPVPGSAAAAAWRFVEAGWTDAEERQADSDGFLVYARAGYDPDRYGDFLARCRPGSPAPPTAGWKGRLPPQAADWHLAPEAAGPPFARLRDRACDAALAGLAATSPNELPRLALRAAPCCLVSVGPGPDADRSQAGLLLRERATPKQPPLDVH